MAMTGGCLCGAVRYSIEAEPRATRACWCRTCQYLGAGSATVNVFFPSEAIDVTGALAAYRSDADSGGVVVHEFCPVCGTPKSNGAQDGAFDVQRIFCGLPASGSSR